MPEQFANRIRRAIVDLRLIDNANARVGVALSGGADSVALLAVLSELGYDCCGLHCNFSLRGDESDGDEAFCRELCRRLGVELFTIKWDARAERLPAESIEMTCRRLRYQWFEKMAREAALARIAVGHHREDSEETMLLNLFRGTGVDGLRGISPDRGLYIRPMLSVGRSDIEDYCRLKGLLWRHDSSNDSTDYRRNALRNVILPDVRQYFPDYDKAMRLTAENLAYASAILDRHITYIYNICVNSAGEIDIIRLIENEGDELAPRSLVLMFAKKLGLMLTLEQANNIVARHDASGLQFEIGEKVFELSRGVLRAVDEVDSREYPIVFGENIDTPVPLTFECVAPPINCQIDSARLLVDASILDGSPRFLLRHPRRGDRLKPFGMKGSRLLSDIFSDMKMDSNAKRRQWVLTRDDEIIWLVGVRASRLFPVTSSTTCAYLLTLS